MKIPRRVKEITAAVSISAVMQLATVSKTQAGLIPGIPDLVFDPAAVTSLGNILTSNSTLISHAVDQVRQAVKIYDQARTTYDHMKAMAQRWTHMDREQWTSLAMHRLNDYTQNRFGETAAWQQLNTGDPRRANEAWDQSTIPLQSNAMFGETQESKAALASVEVIDGINTRCLEASAQYKRNAGENQIAVSRLRDSLEEADSEMEQLELQNEASLHAVTEAQAQNVMQSCIAEQNAANAKVERDRMVAAMNSQAMMQQLRSQTFNNMANIAHVNDHPWY